MFKKSNNGFYFWEEFTKINGIVHGFSTRRFGDMNIKNQSLDNLRLFLKNVEVNNKNVVVMEQVHGNSVSFVSYKDNGRVIDSTDGLISSEKGVFLIGTFADCVPVLFLDKNKKIFGLAHAGWKGVYKEIVKVLISKMINAGASASNILVGLGPSIRICCYNIEKDRERIFKNKYPKKEDIIKRKDGRVFLDLVRIIKCQLIESDVLTRNIFDSMLCTKDNLLDFYSYRAEHGQSSFGLSAAIIGRV